MMTLRTVLACVVLGVVHCREVSYSDVTTKLRDHMRMELDETVDQGTNENRLRSHFDTHSRRHNHPF